MPVDDEAAQIARGLIPKWRAVMLSEALDDARPDDVAFHFRHFERATGLPRDEVRRRVRALARKGLLQYERGLWTDDGEMAGSGYSITEKGLRVRAALEAMEKNDARP